MQSPLHELITGYKYKYMYMYMKMQVATEVELLAEEVQLNSKRHDFDVSHMHNRQMSKILWH